MCLVVDGAILKYNDNNNYLRRRSAAIDDNHGPRAVTWASGALRHVTQLGQVRSLPFQYRVRWSPPPMYTRNPTGVTSA
ncbi:hypothetical protein EVAR_19441_1 [Eumeta japonica]|uniref:Uncharacterized protein n=1 Tax=Eumeta variegata TaxID=151549 RepID=A0A4C1TRM7_EUMVA|nr:hypothetical protein EVAR_19441_1 [Eumeta japonica]